MSFNVYRNGRVISYINKSIAGLRPDGWKVMWTSKTLGRYIVKLRHVRKLSFIVISGSFEDGTVMFSRDGRLIKSDKVW